MCQREQRVGLDVRQASMMILDFFKHDNVCACGSVSTLDNGYSENVLQKL